MEPVAVVIQSMSSSALTDLLQELQGSEGQFPKVLQNKVLALFLFFTVTNQRDELQLKIFVYMFVSEKLHCVTVLLYKRFLHFFLVWRDAALSDSK